MCIRDRVYDLILDSNSVILVCVTVPFIAAVWWKQANRSGALAGMIAGFITWGGTMAYAPNLPDDLLGLLACLAVMLVVTPLTQKFDPPRSIHDSEGRVVEMKDRLGTLPLFRRVQ